MSRVPEILSKTIFFFFVFNLRLKLWKEIFTWNFFCSSNTEGMLSLLLLCLLLLLSLVCKGNSNTFPCSSVALLLLSSNSSSSLSSVTLNNWYWLFLKHDITWHLVQVTWLLHFRSKASQSFSQRELTMGREATKRGSGATMIAKMSVSMFTSGTSEPNKAEKKLKQKWHRDALLSLLTHVLTPSLPRSPTFQTVTHQTRAVLGSFRARSAVISLFAFIHRCCVRTVVASRT